MFYSNLIALCEKNNIKPTPLLKKLGLSSGSLDNWKNGGNINSDALIKIATYFNVSLDFLLMDKDGNPAMHNNGNNNINLANNGDNNSFFAPQQKSQLSEFENQLLELYNSLATPKKMELLNFAFNLKNKEN